MNNILDKFAHFHANSANLYGAGLISSLLYWTVADHEVGIVVKIVEVGGVVLSKLLLFPSRDALTVDRKRKLLALIEKFACRLSQQIVDAPVAEK